MSNVQLPMFNYQLLLAPPIQCIGQKTTPRGQFLWRRGVFPSLADFRKRGSSPFSRMYHVRRHRYSDAAMLLNVVLVAVPTELIAVKQTMTIKANMTAYSTAVGPSSETRKRCIFLASDFIGIPPFQFDSALRSRTGTTNFLGILGTRHRFRYDNRRRPAICLRDPMLVKNRPLPRLLTEAIVHHPFGSQASDGYYSGGPLLCAHGLAAGLPLSRMRGYRPLVTRTARRSDKLIKRASGREPSAPGPPLGRPSTIKLMSDSRLVKSAGLANRRRLRVTVSIVAIIRGVSWVSGAYPWAGKRGNPYTGKLRLPMTPTFSATETI